MDYISIVLKRSAVSTSKIINREKNFFLALCLSPSRSRCIIFERVYARTIENSTLNHYDKASDFLEGDGRFSMRSMDFNNGDAVRTRVLQSASPRRRLTILCVEIRDRHAHSRDC